MYRHTFFLAVLFAVAIAGRASADWPSYRGDAARSGYTSERLPERLALNWSYRATHGPRPAWPREVRMAQDRAFQPIVVGDRVIVGSSADDCVRCLDVESGRFVWRFTADGPVRYAPAAWRDRLFVAADDGYLYALALDDGRLLWRHRPAPSDACVLGNGRVISKWPARGGPVVADDTVYFAAGIWPSEGIFVCALDAATGAVKWTNDASGNITMPQPHGGAIAASGISAQGCLAVERNRLIVPTGRGVPALLERDSGRLLAFHLQKYSPAGGSEVAAAGDVYFNSGIGFSITDGHKRFQLPRGPIAVTPDGPVHAAAGKLTGYRWEEVDKTDRRGATKTDRIPVEAWSLDGVQTDGALIVAGNRIVSGGNGQVDVVEVEGGKAAVVWSANVEGRALGLAATGSTLVVSTDRGFVHCFVDAASAPDAERRHIRLEPVSPAVESSSQIAQSAEEILQLPKPQDGYCVDLGCGDGRLAAELARSSNMHVVAVDADPENVKSAREMLLEAGLYGTRVAVLRRDPAKTGLPRYMADLVVSGRSIAGGSFEAAAAEAARLQRPGGGVLCTGQPGNMRRDARGSLPGAGQWTHQYADAANTVCSDDALVRGRLGMLWFRDFDFQVPQRHGRGPAALYHRGRMFHVGLDGVLAIDAYNGRELWRFDIPGILRAYNGDELMGTAGVGGVACVAGDSLFVRHEHRCLQIDTATGELLGEFKTPDRSDGKPATWGFIACVDGVLVGGTADAEHTVTYRYVNRGGDMRRLLTESTGLFAIDVHSGKRLWQYEAEHSIRHNAVALADGHVFLVDRPAALFDRQKKPTGKDHPAGKLLALDLRTGKTRWHGNRDTFGTLLAAAPRHGALLVGYQPTRFRLDSEFGGRMAVYRTADGELLWDKPVQYASRPIINGRTILAQGGAWDLLSGEPQPFDFDRSYGCGILAGGRHMLVFRSATLGYYDLSGKRTTENYGGVRPACWINAIPAGGLVLSPEATAGCVCSYLNQTWFALEPLPE